MNRVEISGNLTRDPEVRMNSDGSAWLAFTIAVEETYWHRESREKRIVSLFFQVNWTAPEVDDEHMLYKGDQVYIVGSLSQARPEKDDDRPHTRIQALAVTTVRRGRAMRQQRQQEAAGGYADRNDEPPF